MITNIFIEQPGYTATQVINQMAALYIRKGHTRSCIHTDTLRQK